MLWNEESFDVSASRFTKEAYEKGYYAFVSDYVRIYALFNYGGLYFDTDYEVLKSFEELINVNELLLGFETDDEPSMSILYAPPHHPIIKELLDIYNSEGFILKDGSLNLETNVNKMKNVLLRWGITLNGKFQNFDNGKIYPCNFFCPINFDTGELNFKDTTYGVHYFLGSWTSQQQKKYFQLKRLYGKQKAKQMLMPSIFWNLEIAFSIIITFYDNIRVLDACLNKLLDSLSERNDYEIIIINDNPDYDLNYILNNKNYYEKLIIKNLTKNKGYSGACNTGASLAKGKYLIFMDSDIIVSLNWLNELIETAKKYPDFGAISSCILRMQNKRIEYFGMYLYECDSIKPRYNFNYISKYTQEDRLCQIVTSGCMLIKNSSFRKIGGFDEKLYNSHCDLDLSLRLMPLKNYVSTKSLVYHRGTTSGGIRTIAYTKARSLFYKKWSSINMNELALTSLKTLYSEFINEKTTNYYIVINFSTSVFSKIYIQVLAEALKIEIVQKYDVAITTNGKINILDKIDWLITFKAIPIIYFCDQFSQLVDNSIWFENRPFNRDLIADMNGNIISTNKLS